MAGTGACMADRSIFSVSHLVDLLMETPELTLSTAPVEPKLAELLMRWQSWPAAGGLPGRDQFEPADMPHLLPDLVLVEYDRHGNPYRDYNILFRYIGSRVGDDFSMSQSTRSHITDFGPDFANRWFPVFDRLRETRIPVTVQGVPYLIDKTYLRFEMLFLPLARGDAANPAHQSSVQAEVAFALFATHVGPNLQAPDLIHHNPAP
jgi:hypothetical protein